ncbi:MAG: lipid II flippase MurJ, partial [Bacillota bacterium]|nr:lipid II flippase MurJ [Bacillota bacterium]
MSERKLTTAKIAVLVAIATFGSNLLGFVREMVLANYFGAGMVSDAYVMGSSIPTTLLAAVISAMGTAYMPILAMRFEGSGVKAANKFTSQMTNMLLIVVTAFFAISFIFSSQMISIFAPGFSGEKETLTIYYMRVAFIALM